MPSNGARSGSAHLERPPGDPRQESIDQRDDRNLGELLQELRIAGLGVQVLFGFLLAVPFDSRFAVLDRPQKVIYLSSVVLAAVAVLLLSAPVAFHRILFRHRLKERLVLVANSLAIAGLSAVALAMTSAVWLVSSVVVRGAVVPILVAGIGLSFTMTWFVLPLWARIAWSEERRGGERGR